MDDYPEKCFKDIDGQEDGEYLAFLFDKENEPVGTITGVQLDMMMKHLKDVTNKTQQRYVLVKIIESYEGQTIH